MAKLVKGMSSNTRVCRMCGRLFEYINIGYGLCPNCTEIDNRSFHKVKEYLRENGTATAQQISAAVNVSESTIYQYLRDGRVEIPENSPIYIKCELCRTEIRYGRYCQECATTMTREMQKGSMVIDIYEIGERPNMKNNGKMYTYEKRKREVKK